MIFVTVGTHEQQFNRLVQFIDAMKGNGEIEEDVFVQTGYTTYEPKYCTWQKMLPFTEMKKKVAEASIVITHGGPSSFIMPLEVGKTPIVVPRQKKFDEHVNDHQLEFAKRVAERNKTILVAEDVEQLRDMILNYDALITTVNKNQGNNNAEFVRRFQGIVDELFQ